MESIKKDKINLFLLALLVALYVWGYVTNLANPIQTKTLNDIPITLLNLDSLEAQNLSINSNSLPKISVVLEGRFSNLQQFDSSKISASVDLQDLALKEGTNILLVDIESSDSSVKIVKEKTTMKAEVTVEKIVQKEIPLVVQTIGTLEENYIALEAEASKSKIIVSGSKEDLDSIKHILATIDLQNADSDITANAKLKAINKYGEESTGVILKDKEIEITIPVRYSKTVPIEVDISNNPSNGYTLSSSTLRIKNVTIYGDKAVLDKITSIKTEGVDLSRRYYDFDKLLTLKFPEGIAPINDEVTSTYCTFIIEKK